MKNKNDNIHKNEVQEIGLTDEYWQYRVAANITEYHIISRLIFLRIIIPKFIEKSQLFHIKNKCKNVKQYCLEEKVSNNINFAFL